MMLCVKALAVVGGQGGGRNSCFYIDSCDDPLPNLNGPFHRNTETPVGRVLASATVKKQKQKNNNHQRQEPRG